MKKASPEALDRMRAADAEAIWHGKFRCCGEAVRGTPKHIARMIDDHLARGCDEKVENY